MEQLKKSVSVIIAGTNEKQWLQQAFKSILSSEFEGRLEVIYVDNNSHDGSVNFVKIHFPSVHILKSDFNRGYSGANNLGIQKALTLKADYVLIINPDTASPKGMIRACTQFMESHPDFGAIGPLQSIYGENLEISTPQLNEWSQMALCNGQRHLFYMHFPGYYLVEHPIFHTEKIENVLEHAYVQGAAIFIRTSIFKGRPWFDTTYHTYYEEADLCRRIRWLGYRVGLLTNIFIQHKGGGSTAGSLYRRKLMMRNKYYYVLTDPTWNVRQTANLFRGWMKYDLLLNFPKDLWLAGLNLMWLLLYFPKALYQRAQHRKISKGRVLKILAEDKDA